MKLKLPMLAVAFAVAGCSHQAPSFSWYHPQGGEFLFAYDADECETAVVDKGLALGTDTQGPFFQCMHQRGYYLVDADGVVQEPSSVIVADSQQVSQQ